MQKSISEDGHPFNIENIHGIDNLNDLHLNQLNSQLRYELRNLNSDVDVGIHISGDEADYGEDEDEMEEVDDELEEEDNDAEELDDNDDEDDELEDDEDIYNSDNSSTIHMKNSISSKTDLHSQQSTIENALNGAFNESESEPFKNYIKSIVDRGHNEINNNNIPNHSNIPIPLHLKGRNGGYVDEDEDNNNETPANNNTTNNNNTLRKKHIIHTNINGQVPLSDRGRSLKRIKIQHTNGHQLNVVGNNENSILLKKNTDMIREDSISSKNAKKAANSTDSDSSNGVKKCSRCRMKRLQESAEDLEKYQTCMQCRERRKVRDRKPRVLVRLPNLSDDWKAFINKIELNNVIDLQQHNYRAYTDPNEFPRYQPDELKPSIMHFIGEKIVAKYIHPLQDVTGFKFAVRDHHNPSLSDQNRAKKITWMFICSQDKFRRRKSRSENKRQVSNRLKTEECCSKITLSYDIVYGIVQISYNHKHHKPLKPEDLNKLNGRLEYSDGQSSSGSGSGSTMHHHHHHHHRHHHHVHPHTHSHAHVHAHAANIGKDVHRHSVDDIDDEEVDHEEDDESVVVSGGNTVDNTKKIDVDREVVEAAAAAVAAVAASRENEETDVNDQFGEQFGNINMQVGDISMMDVGVGDDDDDVGVNVGVGVGVGVDDVDVDDVDIDVDDVAEIAKLLKQVQQAQSRRLTELEQQRERDQEHEHDHDHDNEEHDSTRDNDKHSDDKEHADNNRIIGEVKEGVSHFLINQSLLEQVREQVGSSLDDDKE